jgi:hypothetical protein
VLLRWVSLSDRSAPYGTLLSGVILAQARIHFDFPLS